jgi:multidrug efflux pump subunit AcrB
VFSKFFIDRPIFASVLSIVITLAGGLALITLPITQYPEITPPTVEVAATYPGANAEVVADTVAAPIEQQVNGVEGMMYMSSQCTNDGTYRLTITFKLGTDLNIAQVLVQNRVSLAQPILPSLVQRRGITVTKKSPTVLMIVNLYSPDNSRDSLYLSNYATIQLRDELARLEGVGDINYLGQRDYSMRLWLDPERMSVLNLSASDVLNAIAQQNAQVAAGQIGQPPVPPGQVFQYTMTTLGRLAASEQFADMILKTGADQRIVRMRDVVRTRFGFRIRLDPQKLVADGLKPADVVAALSRQGIALDADRAAGAPGGGPGPAFHVIVPRVREPTEKEVADLVFEIAPNRWARLGDLVAPTGGVERDEALDSKGVELGAQSYDQTCTLDGKPSVALSVYQLPGSNALKTAARVRAKMDELKERFPAGLDYKIVYDTTPFITESVNEVTKTLRDAVILVAGVVLLFLQNWRSAIIPLVAVPVAIIGTFGAMVAFGFSLNNLTLFGLVLAIGIVVDDAIVVVEAVEHGIEHGLAPREATVRAMEQVAGPVVAVGLVLGAVFVPCMFIGGITGQFFKQFAVTIAISTLISAFNSLTLSPALAALLLKPHDKAKVDPLPRLAFAVIGGLMGWAFLSPWLEGEVGALLQGAAHLRQAAGWAALAGAVLAGAAAGWVAGPPLNRVLGWSFRAFNRAFDASTALYTRAVGGLLRVSGLVLAVYGGLLLLTYYSFTTTPTGFIPQQDKGYLLVNVQLPDAASAERTQQVMRRIEEIAITSPGVSHTVAISGQSILLGANAPNFGAMYVMLDDFHHRTSPDLSGDAIAARLQSALMDGVPEGVVNVFGAPPVEGLGTAGGFKIVLEDRGDSGLPALQDAADRVVAAGNADPGLQGLFTGFRANTPWLDLDIDRTQAQRMGVSMGEVFNALQVYLGSYYVNDFNKFGRTWQVNVQADPAFRKRIEDLRQLKLRNSQGAMVPLGTMLAVRDQSGPVMIVRYNMYPAAPINGNPAPGTSSGQALELMLDAVKKQQLPPSMRTEWTELAFLQNETGHTAMYVFALAVLLVFLVLAAQYESWSLPLAVILVVPMCLLCSIAGVLLADMDVNIFTQIGFVVLVGLACKNAILIVEYAKAQREQGVPRREATLAAVKLRLRPIMMTSLAFILGVVPLVISEGAGAEMRRTLGTAVFAGMLGVTLFGIFLTPVFFYVIQGFSDWRAQTKREGGRPATPIPQERALVPEAGLAHAVTPAPRP